MLDEYLEREDVKKIIVDICNSKRYYDKEMSSSMGYHMYSGSNQLLFLFYDGLFKYKMIIGEFQFFDDYLEQVDKLIRKIDSFSEIGFGINRIIGRVCAYKLGFNDVDTPYAKDEVLRYIYKKYIKEGYFIHGFAPHYYTYILENGFSCENYQNLYSDFTKVQEILKKKKHLNLLDKDFEKKECAFTDSFSMGCYYSANAPMFFSKLVAKNDFIDNDLSFDAYALADYDLCLKNLYKLFTKLKLNDSEKNLFLRVFKNQWKLLEKNANSISLLLTPRSKLGVSFDIESFINEVKDNSFSEAICKLLGQKSNILVSKYIKPADFILINLYGSKKFLKEEKKESLASELEKTFIRSDDDFAFSNTYGKVSIMLLIGAFCITIGVILTMISFS